MARSCPASHNSFPRKQCHSTSTVVLSMHLSHKKATHRAIITKPVLSLPLQQTVNNSIDGDYEENLGVVVAALLVVAAQAATVTIYNPARLVLHIDNDPKDGGSVDQINGTAMTTEMMTMELTQAQQDLQFSIAEGADPRP